MVTKLHRHFDKDGKEIIMPPIIISDEEVQADADSARLKEIANMPPTALKVPQLAESIKLLCKKLGFD